MDFSIAKSAIRVIAPPLLVFLSGAMVFSGEAINLGIVCGAVGSAWLWKQFRDLRDTVLGLRQILSDVAREIAHDKIEAKNRAAQRHGQDEADQAV